MRARSYALQFAAIVMANLVSLWVATQWVANQLEFQAALGAPLLTILGLPIYPPWMLFPWWLSFNDEAASLFNLAGGGVALDATLTTGLAETAVSREPDPVAPAMRSPAALDKAYTRRLADGSPAFSFTRLLGHLATIVRNTLRPAGARPGEATFDLTTRPNPKQQQALDLIAEIAV